MENPIVHIKWIFFEISWKGEASKWMVGNGKSGNQMDDLKVAAAPILGELRVHSGSNPWWVYYGYIMSTLWVPHGYSHMGILWTDRITMWFHLVCCSSKHIVEYSLWVHGLRVIEQQWFLIIYHNFRSPLKPIHIFQSPSRGYVKPIYRL